MIEFVTLAERGCRGIESRSRRRVAENIARLSDTAPILRGAVAIERNEMAGTVKRPDPLLPHLAAILAYVNGAELARYSQQGVVTHRSHDPHQDWPLIVPAPDATNLDEWKNDVAPRWTPSSRAITPTSPSTMRVPSRKRPSSIPCRAFHPGAGSGPFRLSAPTPRRRHRRRHPENTVEVIADAEKPSASIAASAEADMFDVEYWSLEQAKLGKGGEVLGAAGLRRNRRRLRHRAAPRARLRGGGGDRHPSTATTTWRSKPRRPSTGTTRHPMRCDDPMSVRAAFDTSSMPSPRRHRRLQRRRSLAGQYRQRRKQVLRKSFELNFFAHQSVAQNAVRI